MAELAEPTPEEWELFWSMGDVNRDGYIDDVDRDLLAAAFDSYPGDPTWNPDADIDQDGRVGILDLIKLNSNFGLNIWDYFYAPPSNLLIALGAIGVGAVMLTPYVLMA